MVNRRRYAAGRYAGDDWWNDADASDYIQLCDDEVWPGTKVVLCCRVSEYPQMLGGNLADSEANLRREIHRQHGEVVGVVTYVGSGWDPWWLARAVAIAKKHGAILVAETTDRFIRHRDYHSITNPDAQAREPELEELRYWTEGVTLATVLDPDARPSEVRSYQRKRGQWAKKNKGGRPMSKKRRREEKLARVLRLREAECSIREIAHFTKLPVTTVSRWIRRYS